MATITISENSKVKNKEQELKEATSSSKDDLDAVLNRVKKIDNTCSFIKCKNRTNDFAIECKFCKGRFCPTHALQEIHGCGEAVRKDEKERYLHPNPKLSADKHSKAQTKLNMKLKQMQQERKAKQASASKKGNK